MTKRGLLRPQKKKGTGEVMSKSRKPARGPRIETTKSIENSNEPAQADGPQRVILDDGPQRGALKVFDVDLISIVNHVSKGGIPFGIVCEVFKLSPDVRRQLSRIIQDVWKHDEGERSAYWYRRCVELHEVLARAKRSGLLADAFIMGPQEWRVRYWTDSAAKKAA